MDLAQLEATVDVIELRWRGEVTAEDFDVDLGGRRVTIRAAAGYKPILAFVIDQKGLIAGVSLEGAKITKRDTSLAGA